jgi:hypothetical protein
MNSPDTEAGVDYEPKQPTGQSPFHDIQSKSHALKPLCVVSLSVETKQNRR